MKEGIHPDNYRLVVFKDMSNEYAFLSKSAAETKETIQWEDGNEYPLVKVEVSHKSHPFYTGKAQFVDTAGRIDKFRQKYGKFDKKAGLIPEAFHELLKALLKTPEGASTTMFSSMLPYTALMRSVGVSMFT